MAVMPWIPLCDFDQLTEGHGKYVAVAGYTLGVYLNQGNVYALDDRCPHAGASISAGSVVDGCAICPRHDWAFRLDSGYLSDSVYVRVRTYPTRLVEIEGRSAVVEADLPGAFVED